MKHVPRVAKEELTTNLKNWIELRRERKNFEPGDYITAKRKLLDQYFREQGIKVVLVAISGGVDSAIVLGILAGIKSVTTIAVTLPARDEPGATRQDETEKLAELLGNAFNVPIYTFNIHDAIDTIQKGIIASTDLRSTTWSRGQSVAYTRTASLYSLTASLADKYRTVLIGTTNRDEGSYLGYIGKASDGMVDIQPISDLHKSEVYSVAHALRVSYEVIEATPTGDMFDGRNDEEVFGAPYDFVELYTSLRHEYNSYKPLTMSMRDGFPGLLDGNDLAQFSRYGDAIEQLHKYNRHKYIGSSPAVHFDLTPFDLPDGWRTNCNEPTVAVQQTPPSLTVKQEFNRADYSPIIVRSRGFHPGGTVIKLERVLSEQKATMLKEIISQAPGWFDADKHGRKIEQLMTQKVFVNCTDGIQKEAKNSSRSYVWSTDLAEFIFNRISSFLPGLYSNQSDLSGDQVWTKKGINPFFRAIQYGLGDILVPHYDDSFRKTPWERSLMSVVVFLTKGSTRFLREHRALHEYTDQDQPPQADRVLQTYDCNPGDVLIFDHRMLHDSEPILDKAESKLILRSDLMYQRPVLGRALNEDIGLFR